MALFKIILALFLLLSITTVGLFLFSKHNKKDQGNPVSTSVFSPSLKTESGDEPPLLLKSIGVNLDWYDPNTNKAGDFAFTKEKLQFGRLLMGFGFVIPANSASEGKDKANPQPTFIVPMGTPVRSLVDGVVAAMPKVWSGDYSIQVSTNGQLQKWLYETEHVINPQVKVGDHVNAGQVIAQVSDYDSGIPAGFGILEIGILKGGQKPEHVCPFAYLDPSIKEETFSKIKAFYKSWEEYARDSTLYDDTQEVPGCQTLKPIEG